MADRDESEGPGIMVVSLKGEQRPVSRDALGRTPAAGTQSAAAPASPSPFSSPGADANALIFGENAPAGASPRPDAGKSDDALELETPLPKPQKKVRAELEEWGQKLATGEHRLPATTHGRVAPPPSVSRPALRATKPPSSGGGKGAGVLVGLAVLAGLGVAAWRMMSGSDALPALSHQAASGTASVEGVASSSADFVVRPENAPDCWTRDDGFHFVFTASSGDTKTVSHIHDVPVLYRMTARCVPD